MGIIEFLDKNQTISKQEDYNFLLDLLSDDNGFKDIGFLPTVATDQIRFMLYKWELDCCLKNALYNAKYLGPLILWNETIKNVEDFKRRVTNLHMFYMQMWNIGINEGQTKFNILAKAIWENQGMMQPKRLKK